MRQAQFIITPEIQDIVAREVGSSGAPKFLEKLEKGFKYLSFLYACRIKDIPFDTLRDQLLNIRDAAKSLENALTCSSYQVETLIRQGQFLRGDNPNAYHIHTDLVCFLQDFCLGIDTIEGDFKTPANRPSAWQEREVIELFIKCWVEAQGKIPGKTPNGPFHRLVNDLLKQIGLTKRSWDLVKDVINIYLDKGKSIT